MVYHTIYDALSYEYSFSYVWVFGIILLGFVGVTRGALIALKRSTGAMFLCLIGFIILFIVTGNFTASVWKHYIYSKALTERKYSVIEGPIVQLEPKPIFGHGSGRLIVAGHEFVYFDNTLAGALQTNISGFGPVKVGSFVQVYYMTDANGETHILKVALQEPPSITTPTPSLRLPIRAPVFKWP